GAGILSESDSFIREVTEEVRQDRMFALWKKWGPYIIALIVVIVGGAALWAWLETREAEQAPARGATLLAADPASVEQQQALVAELEPPARLVPRFTAAAALADAGETTKAAEAYRAIAASDGLPGYYHDLALLQALRLEAADG